ncbi:MAG: hypothetical protein ACFE75_07425 [Candidatus Hodarchaeota archaeon]
MKKAKIVGLSLLSALLLCSFINISHAAPTYVGINTGNSYIWIASPNMANLNATAINLMGEANWTIAYVMLNQMIENMTGFGIDDFLGVGMSAVITNMTEEMPTFPGANGVGVYADIAFSYQPNNWTTILNTTYPDFPPIWLIDPAVINNTNFMYYMGMAGGVPPLFISKGLPFASIATWMNALYATMPPVYSNMTLSGLPDGFQFTILGEFLEWSMNESGTPFPISGLGNIVGTAKWNANGVLSYGSVSYGGLILATIELVPEAEIIPGYMIPVILGVSIFAVVSIISIIRRKKHII